MATPLIPMTYTAARESFAKVMDTVCNDHTPVVITRGRNQSVVMMSLDEYNSLAETEYLLSSPTNAERLRSSVKQANNSNFVEVNIPIE